MATALLDARTAALVEQERALLEQLDDILASLDGTAETRRAIRQALRDLGDLFLLVVVGEFNAGKSAVINALLGTPVLKEGVTPTTAQIHVIRYGERHEETTTSDGLVIVTHPAPWLRHMALVDTPGTNAVIRRHQEITEDFVPRSDLVLFVTSADRPFTESERLFLERIRQWGKKVIFVVNKADLLEEQELAEVVDFVAENARRALGLEPVVFAVSARLAQQARAAGNGRGAALWEQSRFAALDAYIRETLDQRERLRLKLSTPLGIARRALEEASRLAGARTDLLRADVETLDTIERQLAAYEQDMRGQLVYHLSHVDNILHEMAARGNRFFDETIRLGRLFDLLNSERLKREFEREVIADVPVQVERQVSDLIDWMVDQEHREWRAVSAALQARAREHARPLPEEDDRGFEARRRALLNSVGRAARDVVASYDKDVEVRVLVDSVQTALAQTALVEAGAVGLGALIVALVHGIFFDVTGIVGAGLIAAAGLYLLPARREKARRELAARIDALRDELRHVLTDAFEKELNRSVQGMRDALGPYTRFVRAEQARLQEVTGTLTKVRTTIAALEEEVRAL